MMNSKEALKRLKQETAPATYMVDFDKDKCIEVIRNELEQLEKYKMAIKILKNKLNLNVEEDFFPPAYNDMSDYGEYDWYLTFFDEFINLQDYEYELLKEVLEHDDK